MSSGYIYFETHAEHPGRVRLQSFERKPAPDQASPGAKIRYIARFHNLFRGHQQILGQLSHQLIDVDRGLLRIDLVDAIATVETLALRAERVWFDPSLERPMRDRLARRVRALRHAQLRTDRLWKTVGAVSVALLLLRALLG